MNVGAHSEECIDEVEIALRHRNVEGGHTALRWGDGDGSAGPSVWSAKRDRSRQKEAEGGVVCRCGEGHA
jgi:hypothetical protein